MAGLVIKKWAVNTRPIDDKGTFISITGRKAGFVSWLLSVLRIDPVTSINVSVSRLEFKSASLAGTEHRVIPLESISSSFYGYHKPWKEAGAIIGLAFFLGSMLAKEGNGSAFLLCLMLGIGIAAVYYFLNRSMTLGFIEVSGHASAIQFKRSVIEGIDINEEEARKVCELTQKLIESKARRATTAP
jgi:hypothetical protein